jgi:hypothetical protein
MPYIRRLVKGIRLEPFEYDGNGDSIDRPAPVILTITGGAITIPSSGVYPAPGVYHILPESGTADDLTHINGAIGHEELIVLRTHTVGHVITVYHTVPNLRLATATVLLNSIYDHIAFRSPVVDVWAEDSRVSIPA